jgi:hypothetical protein
MPLNMTDKAFNVSLFDLETNDINQEKFVGGSDLAEWRKTGQLPVAVKASETPGFGGSRSFHRQNSRQVVFLA